MSDRLHARRLDWGVCRASRDVSDRRHARRLDGGVCRASRDVSDRHHARRLDGGVRGASRDVSGKSIWLLLGLAVIFSGCENSTERPRMVSDSTLVEVLADLHLADARSRLPGVPVGLRDSVLAAHGMDSVVFKQAMAPFEEHPEDLVNLYNSVLDRLNAARVP